MALLTGSFSKDGARDDVAKEPVTAGPSIPRILADAAAKTGRDRKVPGSRTALGDLCEPHRNPLYVFVQSEGRLRS
jgi:hypothetical protein